MLADTDFEEISPPQATSSFTADHTLGGLPIPKPARITVFSDTEWEDFVLEWASSLKGDYASVKRFAGAGDKGIDVAGFMTGEKLMGPWDNYQCKHYDHPLAPSDIWVEIGKIIYHAHEGAYVPPRAYFFVAPRGIGTKLEGYLGKPEILKSEAKKNWNKYCKKGITGTQEISLDGKLLSFFESFDFSIFDSLSVVQLIDGHAKTEYHSVRFGGGLKPRPLPEMPPSELADIESRYVRQLMDAYSEHTGEPINSLGEIASNDLLAADFLRQRTRFYHAEYLRNYARDNVPDGTFSALQNEIHYGVIDTCDCKHSNGFERMKATISQASTVALTSNPLVPVVQAQDRQGICHQLANEDRLIWVQMHD